MVTRRVSPSSHGYARERILSGRRLRQLKDESYERAEREIGRAILNRHRVARKRITCEDAKWIARALDTETVGPDAVLARQYERHVCCLAARLNVEILWTSSRNGYRAWSLLRIIEVPPVVDGRSYASALHELGHTQVLCEGGDHRRVPEKAGVRVRHSCVTCEVQAWRWAMATARPGWTRPMHSCLRECVRTYLPLATAAQARSVDDLCSDMTFREARLRAGRHER